MSDGGAPRARSRSPSVCCLIVCAWGLCLLGILALWSVTAVSGQDPYRYVARQSLFILCALLAGGLTVLLGHERLARLGRPLLVATWGLLLVVLAMPAQGGAHRWLPFGMLNLQPSELAKPALILALSAFCTSRAGETRRFQRIFLPGFAYAGVTTVLTLLEPDLGQTLLLMALSLVILLVNGLRLSHVVGAAVVLLPAVVLVMKSSFSYVQQRLAFFTGHADYQVEQGLRALAGGGLLGTGLGRGTTTLGFVPKARNDFIMAAVGEQAGLLGSLLVFLLFGLLLYQGLRIAFKARDSLGFSIAFCATFLIALQAAINLAVVTDSVPPKGMSLPFVSYGGSSLVVMGILLGLLISVARQSRGTRQRDQDEQAPFWFQARRRGHGAPRLSRGR